MRKLISIYTYIPNNTTNLDYLNNYLLLSDNIYISITDKFIEQKLKTITTNNFLHPVYVESADTSTIFNKALNNTECPIKLCLTYNEYIDEQYIKLWYDLANLLLYDDVDAYAIPLVSTDKKYITSKWFLHKDGCQRGRCNFINNNYIQKTDGMDLISVETNNIVSFRATPIDMTGTSPFVIQNDK